MVATRVVGLKELAIDQIVRMVKEHHKILIAGNGGLCAESEHFAAELMGQYGLPIYVPCVSLTANTSLITALANDIGYENVFSHQVEWLGDFHDVFIGMTTSKSPNILKALTVAQHKAMVPILICSERIPDSDAAYVFTMKGDDVAEVQNETIKFLHVMAREIKEGLRD